MEYKALVSFSGAISMSMGEVREIEDPAIVNDLLKAGYIQPAERWTGTPSADQSELPATSEAAVPVKRASKKGGKTKK